MKRFKPTFYEGLVFIVPAALTCGIFYWIFKVFYNFIAAGADYIPPSFYRENPWVGNALEAIIIALMFTIILMGGVIAQTRPGRFLSKSLDRILKAIPFFNFFYDICRQIFDILFMKSRNLLSHPVLVPFPHAGKRTVGFMTGIAEPQLALGEEHAKVYIPTVPFPTSGFMMVFPKNQVTEDVLSAEQALRLILSGGILDETETETDNKAKICAEDEKKTCPCKKIFNWVKSRFFGGMFVFFPPLIAAYITIEIFYHIYALMKFSIALIPPRFGHLAYIDEITPVASLFVLIIGTWLVGLAVKTWLGRKLRKRAYSLISYIPFAGALFHAFRQLMSAALSDSAKTFSQVVLVDFPSPGSKAIGFIMGEASRNLTRGIPETQDQKEYCKVFIPGTPNAASGFLLVVRREDLIPTELSVEEGLLRVVSGGLLQQAAGIGEQKPNG